MRPHRALAATLTAPDADRAAAPDDTGYAAESSGCLVKGTADNSTMNTTYAVSVAVPSDRQQVAATSDDVWASCHGKVPLGKARWERRAGRLEQTIEP
ncbi:hypothetical protein AB0H77_21485 [Streptomyces sp. NPDC050844]|uniref:hypothetical protein n=1 Tax=Streptomyces sp. NPDC050844 TaxID=3155790 RepID=UPI0033EB7555